MRIVLSIIVLIFAFQCNAQHNLDSGKEGYTSKERKSLVKDSKKFEKINFKKAVNKFGEPYETRKIKITPEALSSFLSSDLIEKYFPKNEKQPKESYVLEANWKMLSASWITVWYKLEKNVWKPINTLMTI